MKFYDQTTLTINCQKTMTIPRSDIPFDQGKVLVMFYPTRQKTKQKSNFHDYIIPTQKSTEKIDVDAVCYGV